MLLRLVSDSMTQQLTQKSAGFPSIALSSALERSAWLHWQTSNCWCKFKSQVMNRRGKEYIKLRYLCHWRLLNHWHNFSLYFSELCQSHLDLHRGLHSAAPPATSANQLHPTNEPQSGAQLLLWDSNKFSCCTTKIQSYKRNVTVGSGILGVKKLALLLAVQ
jgi:hypothetical protein